MKRVVLAVVVATGLAGCGGGGVSVLATPTPGACGYVVPAAPPLLYPENGATVADGGFALIVGFNPGYAVGLVGPGSAQVSLAATALPSPLPTPAATPAPGSTRVAYGVPALSAHSTYSVVATAGESGACGAAHFTLGSFTTQ
jgi:hypothetical protein